MLNLIKMENKKKERKLCEFINGRIGSEEFVMSQSSEQ